MIKLIIFDLDGVLVDTVGLHLKALNLSLKHHGYDIISEEENKCKFNCITTRMKLKILCEENKISSSSYEDVYNMKQKITKELLDTLDKDEDLINIISNLKERDYKIYVASNTSYYNVKHTLYKLGIIDLIDFIMSNDDVKHPKPSPEIYFKCMIRENVSVKETLIFEDSDVGLQSAYSSGANVCKIENRNDLTLSKINDNILRYSK